MSPSQGYQALLLDEVSVLSSEGFSSVIGTSESLQQLHLAMVTSVPSAWEEKTPGSKQDLIMW